MGVKLTLVITANDQDAFETAIGHVFNEADDADYEPSSLAVALGTTFEDKTLGFKIETTLEQVPA